MSAAAARRAAPAGGPAVLDELDRRIVAALQQDGRASWTAIAAMCRTSVTTVARRAQQLLADGLVRVAVVPALDSDGPVDLFVLRLSCAPGRQHAVAEQLAARDDVRFVALVTGATDVVAELRAGKQDALHGRLVEEVLGIDGVQRCETDLLLHVYKMAHDWSRQLLAGGDYVPADEPHACGPDHLDPTDRALLTLLRRDGRASFRAVGDALQLNESTVRRRFDALLDRGCVSVVTLVPAPALGFESELLVTVGVAPSRLADVARELARYRGVRYVAATLATSSLMCEVILPTTRDVLGFLTEVLGRLEGVLGWSAGMELRTFKRGFVPMPG